MFHPPRVASTVSFPRIGLRSRSKRQFAKHIDIAAKQVVLRAGASY